MSSLVPVFNNVEERSVAKNYYPACPVSVVSKVFGKLVNMKLIDHLEKCNLFSDFQCEFRSSQSIADFLKVVFDRVGVFSSPAPTQTVTFDISQAFDRVCHASLVDKLGSYKVSSQFALFHLFLVTDGFMWFWLGSLLLLEFLKFHILVLHFT